MDWKIEVFRWVKYKAPVQKSKANEEWPQKRTSSRITPSTVCAATNP